MADTPQRGRFRKLPRNKSFIGPVKPEPRRSRRTLLDRLDDPGVLGLAVSWAASGLSNADISRKLHCDPTALSKVLQRKPKIAKRFEAARMRLVEIALDSLRGRLKSDWRASAFVLERMRPAEWGAQQSNAVDLRKLFGLLSKLAASINGVIPESSRPAVDALVADFIDTLAEDGDDDTARNAE